MEQLQLIQSKIYEIRGQKVMQDFDLAEMYGIETKYLKRSVKNNIRRFPAPDFMFELTKDEWESLRCNFSTLKKGRGQHPKYMPYAFSELCKPLHNSVKAKGIYLKFFPLPLFKVTICDLESSSLVIRT